MPWQRLASHEWMKFIQVQIPTTFSNSIQVFPVAKQGIKIIPHFISIPARTAIDTTDTV